MGEDGGAGADLDARPDDGVRADVRALANLGAGINDGSGMDAGRVAGALVEVAKGAGEGVIGVLDAQRGNR